MKLQAVNVALFLGVRLPAASFHDRLADGESLIPARSLAIEAESFPERARRITFRASRAVALRP